MGYPTYKIRATVLQDDHVDHITGPRCLIKPNEGIHRGRYVLAHTDVVLKEGQPVIYDVIEPTADEIERVALAMGGPWAHPQHRQHWLDKALAAILAMNRRPSPPAAEEPRQEPVAFAEVYSGRVVSVSMTEGRHHTTPLFRS